MKAIYDPILLRKQYVEDGRSAADIANELGCTPAAIWSAVQRFGIHKSERMNKYCRNCQTKLPIESFDYLPGKKSHIRNSRCKDCARSIGLEWQHKNPDKVRAIWYKTSYGISIEDYDRMFEEQGRACAVCLKPEYDPRNKRLCVDHDRKTGLVRGLLCHNCNKSLGLMADDPERLRNAAEYLERIR